MKTPTHADTIALMLRRAKALGQLVEMHAALEPRWDGYWIHAELVCPPSRLKTTGWTPMKSFTKRLETRDTEQLVRAVGELYAEWKAAQEEQSS